MKRTQSHWYEATVEVRLSACPHCAELEAEIYRLAEWEAAKQYRDDAVYWRLAEGQFDLWVLIGRDWLAAEEARIFGKAAK